MNTCMNACMNTYSFNQSETRLSLACISYLFNMPSSFSLSMSLPIHTNVCHFISRPIYPCFFLHRYLCGNLLYLSSIHSTLVFFSPMHSQSRRLPTRTVCMQVNKVCNKRKCFRKDGRSKKFRQCSLDWLGYFPLFSAR
jgi:hypothetical protein